MAQYNGTSCDRCGTSDSDELRQCVWCGMYLCTDCEDPHAYQEVPCTPDYGRRRNPLRVLEGGKDG